jgi:hypothetical protein
MLLAYEFGTLLAFAALAMWIFVWLLVAWRVIARPDIGVLAKVLWIIIILVIPLLGLFVYFLWDAMRTKPA